jgi:hypothetical protein
VGVAVGCGDGFGVWDKLIEDVNTTSSKTTTKRSPRPIQPGIWS